MKIITVAFIFQFLLSCWPKVDIIPKSKQITNEDNSYYQHSRHKKKQEDNVGLANPTPVESDHHVDTSHTFFLTGILSRHKTGSEK